MMTRETINIPTITRPGAHPLSSFTFQRLLLLRPEPFSVRELTELAVNAFACKVEIVANFVLFNPCIQLLHDAKVRLYQFWVQALVVDVQENGSALDGLRRSDVYLFSV